MVIFWFCLSGVLRWAKISLAHFSGRTHCYLVPSQLVTHNLYSQWNASPVRTSFNLRRRRE